jgi:uncharacterized protein (TIGR02270 family)
MRLPDFAADDATRRFNAELYLEHLEEASFLYEQRLGLHDDSEVTWLDIGTFERRLEAHIDALVTGGELAVETCRRRTEEGDPGELYAAVCVFCRGGRRDLLGAVLKRLDLDDAVRSRALRDAMTDEMPTEWADALASSLARGFDNLIPIVTHYLGYRRFAAGGALDKLIVRPVPVPALAQVLWGWGRVGEASAASRVAGYVDHDDAAIRTNAVMALLRRGDDRARAAARERAWRGDPAIYLPLAVSGGRSDSELLQKIVLTQAITPEVLIALGVLGELGAVPLLVQTLTDPELAACAATALQLITGADLREEAFIPEVVNEDELFEEELEAYRETGERPQHNDDRPFGTNVERTSQNPDDWRIWLADHKSHFDRTQRYRLGQPCSMRALVDTLVCPTFGRQVRSLAGEELIIRYGIDIPFETEMRVGEQQQQINAISRLCRAREAMFQPGRWYFAGGVT